MEEPNWGNAFVGHYVEGLSFEDAIKEGERRIIFTGPRR